MTYAITRILFLFSDYEIALHKGTITQLHLIFCTSAYFVTYVSLVFIYIIVEKHMLDRKPVFTILALISGIISFICFVLVIFNVGLDLAANMVPYHIAQYMEYVSGPILIVGMVALYIKMVKDSSGPVKKRALGEAIGLFILSSGLLLDMDVLSSPGFDPIRLLLSPACYIIGVVTYYYSLSMQLALVDFYTNKHVCIVHKGEIKGKVFMCSKCNAYYCLACKEAIEQIDKCCWNCKTPFDQSIEADAATLSQVELLKEIPDPAMINEDQEEIPGKKLGKVPAKGVIAGQKQDSRPSGRA